MKYNHPDHHKDEEMLLYSTIFIGKACISKFLILIIMKFNNSNNLIIII